VGARTKRHHQQRGNPGYRGGLGDFSAGFEHRSRFPGTHRDLKQHIKEAEAMLTHVDVERLPSYELGMEKGEARILLRLLRLKFGDLPAAVEPRIEDADAAALIRWSERVLTAARLEDVLD
jgi:hypothetical protein